MDPDLRDRRQSLRVIASEVIMVITVIITVVILALLVSGYWLNSNFEVERQGMLQIHSTPTGANISVDGDSPWFQRTNTSKVLPSGAHEVVLTKDGYDSWSKTVVVSEGLLYRVDYPRLFLLEREKSVFYDTAAVTFATISPDRNSILIVNNTTNWELLKLNSDEPNATPLDISKLTAFTGATKEKLFTSEIISANWDSNCEHILFELRDATGATEWVLLDVKNPAKSINITREFAINFSELRIFDNSANNLIGVSDGTLRKIDVNGRQISAPIATGVEHYDFFESDIIYSTADAVYLTKLNRTDPPTLVANVGSARPYLSRFYDDKYITLITENSFSLLKKEDFSEVISSALSFSPTNIKIGQGGSFIFMQQDLDVTVLDMETLSVVNWTLDSPTYGWLDGNMVYTVSEGTLIVYDYDGLNRRELSHDVSSHFPVSITDNKWLYYFSDGAILREIIAQ